MDPLHARRFGSILLLTGLSLIAARFLLSPPETRDSGGSTATARPPGHGSGRPGASPAGADLPGKAADRATIDHRLDCECRSCDTGGAESLPRTELTDASAWLAGIDDRAEIPLPGGRNLRAVVERLETGPDGTPLMIEGRTEPDGRFLFRRERDAGEAWPMWGFINVYGEETAWRIENEGGRSFLAAAPADLVVCRRYAQPPPELAEADDSGTGEIPADHPTDIPIPAYQNGVIPLESLPGAAAVVYLDFDGEDGPHEGWGDFDAAPATNLSVSNVKGVWQRVAEDYAPFNINVTTDLAVFLAASDNSRQRCIITPTTTAAPGAGGVAYIGSFNSSGDQPCWAFYSSGKSSAEVVSHEVGHTLNLGHDGRTSPSEEYYGGHGNDPVGWAPIMGVGYYENLTQWSKGEYLNANRTQDDTAIIANNNSVDIRDDDAGGTLATADYLEILSDSSVSSQGVIATPADVDAFRFKTSGGSVNLSIDQVSPGPNLDILAELRDASNGLVASSNPDTALDATISTSLVAGEYTLQVSGTGRGDPLGDGYTDYGCLGAYTISGSVTGGEQPARFTIAENPAAGASVGTVTPRLSHGGNGLQFAVSGGDPTGAFAIHPTNGGLFVATPSAFDFETLSPSWEFPATRELFVTITDTVDPLLNEQVRVVVTVTDVNESPSLAGGSAWVPAATMAGTGLFTAVAEDPDRFQELSYSITGGNSSGWFAIDPASGVLRIASPPTAAGIHHLNVRAADSGSPSLAATAEVTVTVYQIPAGYSPGSARRTIYDGISGNDLPNLTGDSRFPEDPDREVGLDEFADSTRGDDYGSTVRAFLFPPVTGSYTFWIAGDDDCELWLSNTASPAGMTLRASIDGWTDYLQWNRYSSQQSAAINLTAGQAYYLEARHKEGGGGDHVAVAWQASVGGSVEIPQQVIPLRHLAAHSLNYKPRVNAATVTLYETAYPGTTVADMSASDLNPGQSRSYAITGGNSAGVFGIDPSSGRVFVADHTQLDAATDPGYSLTIAATDDGSPAETGTGTLTVQVRPETELATTDIVEEIWDGIGENYLSYLYSDPDWPDRPDRVRQLTGLNSGDDFADYYGARLRAYVIPPATGSYTFWLASDDEGVLLVSTSDNPAGAVQRASVPQWTNPFEWTKFSEQQSSPITLTAGQRYYIEARFKEGVGGDHVAVGWTGPGITDVTIPSGGQIEPFDCNTPPVFGSGSYGFATDPAPPAGTPIGTVSAASQAFESVTYAILSGNTGGAFAVDPQTGAITVASPAAVAPGTTFNLVVGAQDDGYGGLFPPDDTTVPVTVQVSGAPVNQPPVVTLLRPASGNAGIPAGCGMLLDVSTSDDGLPESGGPVTVAWSRVSGPGTATFTAPSAPSTGVTFSAAGTYLLRASADDGELVGTADITIVVGAAGSSGNLGPVASAGADFSTTLGGTALGGSISDDGAPFTSAVYVEPESTWSYRKGTSEASSPVNAWRELDPPFTEDAGWLGGQAPIGYGDSDDNTVLGDMQNGYTSVYLRKTFEVQSGRIPDQLTMRVYVDDGAVVWINGTEVDRRYVGSGQLAYNATADDHEAGWDTVTIDNTASLLVAGTNLVAVHGLNRTLDSSDFSVDLELGSDRVPAPLGHFWTRISGPGTVNFANITSPTTSVSFSALGTYVLRLSGFDGETVTYDEVTVTVTSQPPVADDLTVGTLEDQPVAATLTGSDPESAPLTFTVVDPPDHGSLDGTAPDLTYTPAAGFHGTDSFQFKVNDGESDSPPATVTVGVDGRPQATPQAVSITSTAGGPVTLSGSDPEDATLAFAVTTPPTKGSLSGSGADLHYTPAPGQLGSDSFEFVANDGSQDSAPATVSITIDLPPIDVWKAIKFGADAATPEIAGDDEDPELDGIVNILEYALGLEPLVNQPATGPHDRLPVAEVGPGYFAIVYRRNLAATDIVYQVEQRGDLGPAGSWQPASVTEQTVSESGDIRVVRAVLDNPPPNRGFMRLSVSRSAQ